MAYRGIDRPSVHDDEEELLQLNANFAYQPPARPAATSFRAVPLPKPQNASLIDQPKVPALAARGPGIKFKDAAPAKKRSLFAERRALREKAEDADDLAEGSAKQSLRREIHSADQAFNQVLSDIVEKNPSEAISPAAARGGLSTTGFPVVVHRSERAKTNDATSRTTRPYAQDILAVGPAHGYGGHDSIHEENLRTLQGMSSHQMEEARAEILAKLDPSLIAMLESRAAQKYSGSHHKSISVETLNLPKEQCHSSEGEMTVLPRHLAGALEKHDAAEQRSTSTRIGRRVDLPHASWIPTSDLEYEKLEWTVDLPAEDGNTPPSKDAADLRFGFSGEIIEKSEDIAHHRALHHHGDEPTKAGYSVEEMLSLSRSSVPSQRAIALRILAAILQNAHNGTYSRAVSHPLLWLLIRKNYMMHLRIAMDDSHETVIGTTVAAMAASLGSGSLIDEGEEHCWDELSYGRQGHRAFATSVESQKHFHIRATGVGEPSAPLENESSVEGITMLMRRDVVSGLLATNILTRFSWLLLKRNLPFVPIHDILSILIRMCRHSRSSAAQIAECPDLVQVIHSKFLALPSTARVPDDCNLRFAALKLMRLLCQSGSDVAASLAKFGLVHDMLRNALIDPGPLPAALQALSWRLQAEAWAGLTVFFAYRLSASSFDEYRGPLLEAAQRLLRTRSQEGSNGSRSPKISFLRTLAMLLRTFGDMLDVGGKDDALRPFVELALEHGAADAPFHLRSAEWDFLLAYGVRLTKSNPIKAPSYLMRLQTLLTAQGLGDPLLFHGTGTETLSLLVEAAALAATSATPDLGQHFVGLHDGSRVEVARALVRLNWQCESLASLIDILSGLRGTSSNWDAFANDTLNRVEMRQIVFRLVEQTTNIVGVGDWLRCFFPAKGALLYSWVASGQDGVDIESTYISKCAIALAALPALVPGDEFMAATLLNRHILHPRVQATLAIATGVALSADVKQDRNEHFDSQRLQELLDYDMYSDSVLEESEAMYGRRARQATSLLMDGGATEEATLPVRADWMYSPFQRLMVDSERFGHLIAQARRLGKIEQGRGDALVVECLYLIERIDKAVQPFAWCRRQLAEAVRVARLMCVFLVPSSTPGHEIFARKDVGTLMDTLLRRCSVNGDDSWHRCNLEQACGGRTRFYQLYKSLIEQFAAASFGDPVFARYLLLPLSMRYPVDFRELFWSELYELLPIFALDAKDVVAAGRFADYFEPLETEEQILLLYIRSLADGKVAASTTPFLYEVAAHHVSGLLREIGDNTEKSRLCKQAADVLGPANVELLKARGGVAPDGILL
ncbi:RNA polymerase II associated protein 1 [Geranomyces michiganensis]|nr:RNA polymerase II associated protein 1 [Geranomyces michiganensis]